MSSSAAPALDFRNVNSLWCSVIVETLACLGLKYAVISPGSRSTALTFAFARHPGIEAIPVLDERSASYFALGLAKQHRRPVVLVCTSGTAGANYFPAVIEARESNVPLIVVTADRPPEMRECSSGQTIDQQKLYGSYVSWYHELALPDTSLEMLGYVRQTLLHAWERASAEEGGPVHLNAPFRDPLPPIEDARVGALAASFPADFFNHLRAPERQISSGKVWQRTTTARGLIVAGAMSAGDRPAQAQAILALGHALGWPIFADALSPLRNYAPSPDAVITAYDTILRNADVARALIPRTVLCLGGWPTSKVLRAWLEQSQAEVLLVSTSQSNRDALHGKTRQVLAPVEAVVAMGEAVADTSYRALWHSAERLARAAFAGEFARDDFAPFEGKAAWLLPEILPPETPFFVANSMPVRDVEYFWGANDRGIQLFYNRGANGIDGTLSTALGLAHGNRPAVLLTGDLALLHDTNGFLQRPNFRGSLTILLINNRGGGIFEHLPVAAFDPPFEKFFATPQEIDFAILCGAFGVHHQVVRDWPHFKELFSSLPEKGIRVLELKTDRKRDSAFRKKFFAKVAIEIGRALPK